VSHALGPAEGRRPVRPRRRPSPQGTTAGIVHDVMEPLPSPMSSHTRALPAGFVAPCLPSSAPRPPSGKPWLHEIKHDGFRVIARKDGARVKLYSRPGNDLTKRFPLIVEALARMRPRSCILDGEAVACGEDGNRVLLAFQLLTEGRRLRK
jgi:ATP-dependent DNA ligase